MPLICRGCFQERVLRCWPRVGASPSFVSFHLSNQPITAPLPTPVPPLHLNLCQLRHARNSLSEGPCQLPQKCNAVHMPFILLHKFIKLTAARRKCYDYDCPHFNRGLWWPGACLLEHGPRSSNSRIYSLPPTACCLCGSKDVVVKYTHWGFYSRA